MKITVFTSNQPRHVGLVAALSTVADKVWAVLECNTVFPGEIRDNYGNSEIMAAYFSRMRSAEKDVFGEIAFSENNVSTLSLKYGDLSKISRPVLEVALQADAFIVFGASYIRGWLGDYLINRRAINIHMGVSPYYRGAACNFWAVHDGHPELAGATIHLLERGLDSGPILYHALPGPEKMDAFELGMKAVKAAHESIVERLASGELFRLRPAPQTSGNLLRYSKNADFTDEIAGKYLEKTPEPEWIQERLLRRDLSLFQNPYIGRARDEGV